jgi:hypothetical protein
MMELDERRHDDVDLLVRLANVSRCRPEDISEMWLYRYDLSERDIVVFFSPERHVQCLIEAPIPDET